MDDQAEVIYKVNPSISKAELNALFQAVWGHEQANYLKVLHHSLSYICAYEKTKLIGFVNLAWDGGIHAFILDTSVHPEHQKQGVGTELVKRAIKEARAQGCDWVHVDYEAHLDSFYKACGFRSSFAGVLKLN